MKPTIRLENGTSTVLLVTPTICFVEKIAKYVEGGEKRLRSLKVTSTTGAVLYERESLLDRGRVGCHL